jgi:hypothetical protein
MRGRRATPIPTATTATVISESFTQKTTLGS